MEIMQYLHATCVFILFVSTVLSSLPLTTLFHYPTIYLVVGLSSVVHDAGY